jgi:hypothetical protein
MVPYKVLDIVVMQNISWQNFEETNTALIKKLLGSNFCLNGITDITSSLLPELCILYFWCQFGLLIITVIITAWLS